MLPQARFNLGSETSRTSSRKGIPMTLKAWRKRCEIDAKVQAISEEEWASVAQWQTRLAGEGSTTTKLEEGFDLAFDDGLAGAVDHDGILSDAVALPEMVAVRATRRSPMAARLAVESPENPLAQVAPALWRRA
jgi:hypothetical protein